MEPTRTTEKEQVKLMADQFVSDVIQLAITKMTRRAEAGKDTENILVALKKIQLQDASKPVQRFEKAKRGRKQYSDDGEDDEEVTRL